MNDPQRWMFVDSDSACVIAREDASPEVLRAKSLKALSATCTVLHDLCRQNITVLTVGCPKDLLQLQRKNWPSLTLICVPFDQTSVEHGRQVISSCETHCRRYWPVTVTFVGWGDPPCTSPSQAQKRGKFFCLVRPANQHPLHSFRYFLS